MIMGMLLGLLCAISGQNWMLIWLGLETNLMSFLMLISQNLTSKKKLSLYFVVQSFGSLLILAGGVLQNSVSSSLITIGLAVKLGLIPVHFWIMPVISSLLSYELSMFLTMQKIGPLTLLFSVNNSKLLFTLLVMNAVMGGIMVLSCTLFQHMVMFSGMVHVSWLLGSVGNSMFWEYMGVYMLILTVMVYCWSNNYFMSMSWNLLNLGGLPPFWGFWVKLKPLMILNMISIPVLLSASMMTLYAYIRLLLSSLAISKIYTKEDFNMLTFIILFPH
uniref:NADH-ubiquinone oxidoreductase chain 2 n=1 Tax=Spadella cephaloptera TaxID=52888 RepID=A0A141CKF0_9BILA|nr:NADH dehydrogenase subunit 2 [Spadella cephaloptera]